MIERNTAAAACGEAQLDASLFPRLQSAIAVKHRTADEVTAAEDHAAEIFRDDQELARLEAEPASRSALERLLATHAALLHAGFAAAGGGGGGGAGAGARGAAAKGGKAPAGKGAKGAAAAAAAGPSPAAKAPGKAKGKGKLPPPPKKGAKGAAGKKASAGEQDVSAAIAAALAAATGAAVDDTTGEARARGRPKGSLKKRPAAAMPDDGGAGAAGGAGEEGEGAFTEPSRAGAPRPGRGKREAEALLAAEAARPGKKGKLNPAGVGGGAVPALKASAGKKKFGKGAVKGGAAAAAAAGAGPGVGAGAGPGVGPEVGKKLKKGTGKKAPVALKLKVKGAGVALKLKAKGKPGAKGAAGAVPPASPGAGGKTVVRSALSKADILKAHQQTMLAAQVSSPNPPAASKSLSASAAAALAAATAAATDPLLAAKIQLFKLRNVLTESQRFTAGLESWDLRVFKAEAEGELEEPLRKLWQALSKNRKDVEQPPKKIPGGVYAALRGLHSAHRAKSEKNDDPWYTALAEGLTFNTHTGRLFREAAIKAMSSGKEPLPPAMADVIVSAFMASREGSHPMRYSSNSCGGLKVLFKSLLETDLVPAHLREEPTASRKKVIATAAGGSGGKGGAKEGKAGGAGKPGAAPGKPGKKRKEREEQQQAEKAQQSSSRAARATARGVPSEGEAGPSRGGGAAGGSGGDWKDVLASGHRIISGDLAPAGAEGGGDAGAPLKKRKKGEGKGAAKGKGGAGEQGAPPGFGSDGEYGGDGTAAN